MTRISVRLKAQGSRLRARPDTRREARDPLTTGHWPPATVLAAVLLLFSCTSGPPSPASLDVKNDTCAHCRMAVSDRRFAAQIVAPGEEALFFDDLGCLRDYLSAAGNTVSDEAVVYVADHRTAEWVDARQAVFTRRENLATPMASGLMAHRDTSSLKEDREAQGAVVVAPGEILFGRGAGGGR